MLATALVGPIDVSEPAIRCVPNPADNSCTLHLENIVNGVASLTIYDAAGRSVMSMNDMTSQTVEIDLHTLPPGLYYAEVDNGVRKVREKIHIVR